MGHNIILATAPAPILARRYGKNLSSECNKAIETGFKLSYTPNLTAPSNPNPTTVGVNPVNNAAGLPPFFASVSV